MLSALLVLLKMLETWMEFQTVLGLESKKMLAVKLLGVSLANLLAAEYFLLAFGIVCSLGQEMMLALVKQLEHLELGCLLGSEGRDRLEKMGCPVKFDRQGIGPPEMGYQ